MTAEVLTAVRPRAEGGRKLLSRVALSSLPLASIAAVMLLTRPRRGIDVTDEMMYLLAARSGHGDFIHSPWGWHTAPLLRLAGEDVAVFRLFGVLVLSLSAIVLAFAARDFVAHGVGRAPHLRRLLSLEGSLLASGAVLWSGLFYLGLLRSPGHNWVAVTGLLIAASGMLRCLAASSPSGFKWGVGALAGGLLFVLPARPASVVVAAPLVILTVAILRSWADGARAAVLGAVYGAAGVLLLVLSGVWPADFLRIFLRAARTPALVEQSQVTAALLAIANYPMDWARTVSELPFGRALLATAVGGSVLLLLMVAAGGEQLNRRIGAAVSTAAPLPIIGLVMIALVGSRSSRFGLLVYGSSRWGAALVGATLLSGLLLLLRTRVRNQDDERGAARTGVAMFTLLAVATTAGIGTAGSLVGLTSNATGIVAVGLLLPLLAGSSDDQQRVSRLAVWAVGGALASTALLSANWASPYRMAHLDDQTHPVEILGGEILVDDTTRDQIADIRRTASTGGYQRGERLVTLMLPWSTLPPVVLNSEVMPSLAPTIFQYRTSVEMGEFNLALLAETWDDAWVMVDRDRRTGRYERLGWQIAGMEERLVLATGRQFPTDYVCVAEGETVQLWMPFIEGQRGPCGYVAPPNDRD